MALMSRLSILCLGVCAAAIAACTAPSATVCEKSGVICPENYHCAAVQQICIPNGMSCGDGHEDSTEECDDGNLIDGDGCSHECKIEDCGNGRVDRTTNPPEQCDDGKENNGKLPSKCSKTCQNVVCGNNVTEQGEQCDDGNTTAGDGCSATCQSEFCGNHFIDPGEVCDDGALNGTPGDPCSANCRSNLSCNNATVDPGEECDHGRFGAGNMTGNNDNNDCRADCQFNRCGDGFVDNQTGPRHETCDAGHLTGLVPNPTETSGCNINCSTPSCGDGIINRHFTPPGAAVGQTEECDNVDGSGHSLNADNADCTATCQVNVCGDGKVDAAPGPQHEDCDDGAMNGMLGSLCTRTCHMVSCGDGIVDQNEQCDDGMANNGPGQRCNASCKFNVCGDGDTYAAAEQCDGGLNGTRRDTATCNADCTKTVCGDGHRNMQASEACDDGALNGTMASPNHCDKNCHLQSCGNGLLDPGEQCDPGGGSSPQDTETCNSNCTVPVCGDGHPNAQAHEECDDGVDNGTAGSTCSTTCQMTHCGNGIKEQNEDCDDGDATHGNGNNDNARCKTNCKFNKCGDGKVFTGVEQCDGGVGGVPTDTTTCDKDCTFAVCGDGYPSTAMLPGNIPLEVCDDGVLNGTAASTHNCDLLCRHQGCGNGLLEPALGEQCDPGTGSPATDSATCTFDCKVSFCGDHHINSTMVSGSPVEVCDEGATNGDPCPYGTPNCSRCSNDCKTANIHPGGPFCGDSVKNGTEACDPGGGVDVMGNPSPVDGPTCDFDCTAATCGDGHRNMAASEACDDGNITGCGGCNVGCTAVVTPAQASGSITTHAPGGTDIVDADNITLDDGRHPKVVFEFDLGGMQNIAGSVVIAITGSETADDVGVKLRTAILAQKTAGKLDITPTAGATDSIVNLKNTHNTSRGNTAVVAKPTGHLAGFTFVDLAGGLSGDCAQGVGCTANADCFSNSCTATATAPGVCVCVTNLDCAIGQTCSSGVCSP